MVNPLVRRLTDLFLALPLNRLFEQKFDLFVQ
jgi:hypothetical protein